MIIKISTVRTLFLTGAAVLFTACGGGGGGGGGGAYSYTSGSSAIPEHTVTVTAGNAYSFETSSVSGEYYFLVYDSSYAGLGATIPDGFSTVLAGGSDIYSFIPTVDETFTLVFAPTGTNSFQYTLNTTTNELLVDSTPVNSNTSGSVVYYSVDVEAGLSYEVQLTSNTGNADIIAVYPDMSRTGSLGSSSRSDVIIDRVGFTATTTGRHYVKIDSTSSQADYSLAVSTTGTEPDLEVVITSVDSDSVNLSISYKIYNNGISDSGSFLLDAWTDLAAAPALGQAPSSSRAVSNIPGNGSLTGSFFIAETNAAGTAYLAVDSAETVIERDETNNITAGMAWLATEPDLKVSIEQVYANGTDTIIKYRIDNLGSRNAGSFTVQVWPNPVAPPAVGDFGDGSFTFTSLSASGGYSNTITIPNVDLSGTAYAIIDTVDSVNESDESNNISAGFAWVETYPDLRVSIDNVVSSGTNVTIDYTVTNGLENYAPQFNVDFWTDSSAAPSGAGESSVSHVGLAPGASLSDTIILSSTLSSGTAFAIVDTGGLIQETSEANNVSLGAAWVASLPDLNIIIERVISDGANAKVYVEIRNSGPGIADGIFDVEFWMDSGTIPAIGGTGVHTESFDFSASPLGTVAYRSRIVTIPTTLANGVAYALIDNGQAVAESDETNNVTVGSVWAITTASPDMDVNWIAIPDNDLVTGASAGITLAGMTTSISKVVVGVYIQHGFMDDIDIYLESPLGTMIELSTDNNGCGSGNYGETGKDAMFDDSSSETIQFTNDCPFLGVYKPEQPLADLNGEDANGTWTLHVYDDDSTYSTQEGSLARFNLSVQ